jgi:hypothetical protein
MIAITELFVPTRWSGMAAYGTGVLSCGAAWSWGKRAGVSLRLAAVLAFIEATLFLDIAFNWRWTLHSQFVQEAVRRNLYGERRGPQEAALVVLASLFCAICGFLLRLFRTRGGAVLAVWGVCLAIGVWITEVISLHAVDHVLYHRLGSLLFVCYLWIAAALMTSTGILMDAWQAGQGSVPPAA